MADSNASGTSTSSRLPQIISGISGVLAGTVGVLGVADQFVKGVAPFLEGVPPQLRWPLSGLLLILTLFLIARALRPPRSTLHPNAEVRDEILERRDLVGRDKDVDDLVDLCKQAQIVFVVGESGAGKSSILRAGLCDVLRSDAEYLPVYIDAWGLDWVTGPRTSLLNAIAHAAPVDAAAPAPAAHASVVDAVEAAQKRAGRRLLVVFDQLDDYQAQHRSLFFTHEGRKVLSPDHLKQQNEFWREIAELVGKGMRCVFATRVDAQSGLESVRFINEPGLFNVGKLDGEDARKALKSLFVVKDGAALAVRDAESTWRELSDRIIRDLVAAGGGAVLPAQLRIVGMGLQGLLLLTVEEYERRGGLVGLATWYLDRRIALASSNAGIDVCLGRELVMSMVDVSLSRPKARPRASAELLEILCRPGVAAGGNATEPSRVLDAFLGDLERQHVVRRIGQGSEGGVSWTIYHDYVARTARDLDFRTRKWRAILEDGAHRYADAKAPLERARALIRPVRQIQLLSARIIEHGEYGGFRYYPHRAYAVICTIWFVPYVLFVAAGAYGTYQWWISRQARALIDRFSLDEEFPKPGEIDALRDLARADRRVQDVLLDRVLASPEFAARFSRGTAMITHAVVGLDRARRAEVEDRVRQACLRAPTIDPQVREACAHMTVALDSAAPDLVTFTVRFAQDAAAAAYEEGGKLSTPRAMIAWIQRSRVLNLLPREAAAETVSGALRAMQASRSLAQSELLVAVVAAAPVSAAHADIAQAFQASRAMKRRRYGDDRRRQLRVLWSLVGASAEPEKLVNELYAELRELCVVDSDLEMSDALIHDVEPPRPIAADIPWQTMEPRSIGLVVSSHRSIRETAVARALVNKVEKTGDVQQQARDVECLRWSLLDSNISPAIDGALDALLEELRDKPREAPEHPSKEEDDEKILLRMQEGAKNLRPALVEMSEAPVADALDDLIELVKVMNELETDRFQRQKPAQIAQEIWDELHDSPSLAIVAAMNGDLPEVDLDTRDEKQRWLQAVMRAAKVMDQPSSPLATKPHEGPREKDVRIEIELAAALKSLEAAAVKDVKPSSSSGELARREGTPSEDHIVKRLKNEALEDLAATQAVDRILALLEVTGVSEADGALAGQEEPRAARELTMESPRASDAMDIEPRAGTLLAAVVRSAAPDTRAWFIARLVNYISRGDITATGAKVAGRALATRYDGDARKSPGVAGSALAARQVIRLIQVNRSGDAEALGDLLRRLQTLAPMHEKPSIAMALLDGMALLEAMESTHDYENFKQMLESLGDVMIHIDPQQGAARLLRLLRWPTCVDECRLHLLASLKTVKLRPPAERFWETVAWAEKEGLLTGSVVLPEKSPE